LLLLATACTGGGGGGAGAGAAAGDAAAVKPQKYANQTTSDSPLAFVDEQQPLDCSN